MWTRPAANTRPRSTGMRMALLLVGALVGPWLMGAMAATPTDRVELSGQTGGYVFTPAACGAHRMQLKHSEGQLRWTHRTPRASGSGGIVVSHVDLYVSRSEMSRANQSQRSEDDARDLLVLGRGQLGIDWLYVGFRLGITAGMWWEERTAQSGTGELLTDTTRTLQVALPAFSLRVGSQRLHARIAFADGTWQLRPADLTLGCGFGSGGDDPVGEPELLGYVGFGADTDNAPNDAFVYAGGRVSVDAVRIGLQGRVGPDGWAGGLWLGVPL